MSVRCLKHTLCFRSNIDPFLWHTDEELWRALDKCYMKRCIMALPGQLDTTVTYGGGNFSAGERQLLCLVRAVLSHRRILIVHEITSGSRLCVTQTMCDVSVHRTVCNWLISLQTWMLRWKH